MSESVVLPAEACLPLPEGVDLDIGALVEPLSVAWHAVAASPLASLPASEASVLVLGKRSRDRPSHNSLADSCLRRRPNRSRSRASFTCAWYQEDHHV